MTIPAGQTASFLTPDYQPVTVRCEDSVLKTNCVCGETSAGFSLLVVVVNPSGDITSSEVAQFRTGSPESELKLCRAALGTLSICKQTN